MLSLAVTTHLYPRLEAERFGAGRLTKIRAQAVSGRSCRDGRGAARAAGAAARRGAGRRRGQNADALVRTERVLASVIEAVIGACYLAFGYEADGRRRWSRRSRRRSSRRSSTRRTSSRRCRSGWRAAGELVAYEVTAEEGPPHDRIFEVAATVDGVEVGAGLRALEEGRRAGRGRSRRRWRAMTARRPEPACT